MGMLSPTVLGGLELMSLCVFAIIVLIALIISLAALAAYLGKKYGSEDLREDSSDQNKK